MASITDKTGKQLSRQEIVDKIIFRVQTMFLEFINYLLFVTGYVPFHHYRRLVYRLFGMKIGKGSTLHMRLSFYNSYNIIIGQDTIIGEGTVLDGRAKLTIGDHVDIASEVMIYNSQHDVNAKHFSAVETVVIKPITIEDYVFIGPRVIILPEVTVGKGAVVAAGAVVTKDVPPFAIVAGVPAKIIGERKNKDLAYKLGRAAWFR